MMNDKKARPMSTPWGSRLVTLAALFSAATAIAACGGKVEQGSPGNSATAGGSAAATTEPAISDAQLSSLVAKASSIKKVPDDLNPSLTAAAKDFEDLTAGGRCAKGTAAPELGKCVHGDPDGKQLAVLYGDSHAGMWLTAVNAAATRAHWRLILLAHAGCPAPVLTYVDDKGKVKDCAAFRKTAAAKIKALKPDLLVAASASPGQRLKGNRVATSDEWRKAWVEALKDVRSPGQQQVLLGDIPVLKKVNPDCLAAHMNDVQACSTPRKQALNGVQIKAEEAAAKAAAAEYVDVIPWFCSTTCSPVIGNTGVFRNQFHTTAAYGRLVSGPVGRALGWPTAAS